MAKISRVGIIFSLKVLSLSFNTFASQMSKMDVIIILEVYLKAGRPFIIKTSKIDQYIRGQFLNQNQYFSAVWRIIVFRLLYNYYSL